MQLVRMCVLCALIVWTAGFAAAGPQKSLTNIAIIEMVAAKLSEQTIVTAINSGTSEFDTSAQGLIALTNGGVSENIISAMLAVAKQKADKKAADSRAADARPVDANPADSKSPERKTLVDVPPTSPSKVSDSQVAPTIPAIARIVPGSKVYVEKMAGFETYLNAALAKKKVQLVPVADEGLADYVISGTSQEKRPGWAKIVFMGNLHSDNAASITMVDRKTSTIVFAYAVDKKSTLHGQQTTAEACAKHLQAHIEGRE